MDLQLQITEIIEKYETFGWKPKILLCDEIKASNEVKKLASLKGFEIRHSQKVLAIWFCRENRKGSQTWELRKIGGTPIAVLRFINQSMTSDEKEELLKDAENELSGRLLNSDSAEDNGTE